MKNDLYILLSIYDLDQVPINAEYIMIEELAREAKTQAFVKKIFHYKSVHLLTADLEVIPMPFLVSGVCRLMTLGQCEWCDDRQTKKIHVYTVACLMLSWLHDYCAKRNFLKKIRSDLSGLREKKNTVTKTESGDMVAYIRSDLPQHLKAGGSLGHIAGVLYNIEAVTGGQVRFVTTEQIPSVNKNIPTYILQGKVPMRNLAGAVCIALNDPYYKRLESIFENQEPKLIYHRYALGAYATAKYALKHNIPYILEYNGSELWIMENWSKNAAGTSIPFSDIFYEIEDLVIKKAALITCVSEPLKRQLLERDISEERILVRPNGVNTDVYSPEVEGDTVRERYNISKDKLVIGFIGTFGAWHGTEKLALAYRCLQAHYSNLHLLMIGDGQRKVQVEEVLRVLPESSYTLTGMVPQNEGPSYLAAADILVSPTIPNPDGTPFFGSPTKLFEYMAMGKAIVSSGMDQMAEILEDGKTALLCKPGDETDLEKKIELLILNPELRKKLAIAARREACENHTWMKHTQAIFEKYESLVKG